VASSCKGQEAHASDIGCICIRLSSSLCCGLASHVRGEAVTQSFRTLLSTLLSHQPRISTPLYLPQHFFLLSPFFSISNLPTAHSKHLHPVFATLPAFLHTITWSYAYTYFAYLFQVKPYRMLNRFLKISQNILQDITTGIKSWSRQIIQIIVDI